MKEKKMIHKKRKENSNVIFIFSLFVLYYLYLYYMLLAPFPNSISDRNTMAWRRWGRDGDSGLVGMGRDGDEIICHVILYEEVT